MNLDREFYKLVLIEDICLLVHHCLRFCRSVSFGPRYQLSQVCWTQSLKVERRIIAFIQSDYVLKRKGRR